ncbi:MAG TPA: mechanosensitive ion channel family protein [Armatimonadetes bacterium]|nr:mechanosensitive ion channel family protein [Armatimonadota bacterium]
MTFWQSATPAQDLLTAGGILGASLLTVILVRLAWQRLLSPFVRRTETELDDAILVPLRRLVLWGIFLLGLYYSFGSLEAVQSNPKVGSLWGKVMGIAWVLLAIWTTLRLFNGVVAWYVRQAAERPEGARDLTHQAGLVRKAVNIVLLALGLFYILQVAGLDISPLLAGGAIGGLAVALALQDTLSNLFAGFYLNIDRPVKEGDFIRLESGEEGFVEEIGWRNTKVRMWANNVVVIPNSKLSQSIITNYYLPQQEMSVYVWCGVSYDSDLQYVEEVTVEVAKEVMQRVEGSDTEWEPVVRWKEFGDFAITFVTVLRVKEFGAQYKLQSEFIKALHRRFQEEGIEIPFPIRTVILKPATGETHAGYV